MLRSEQDRLALFLCALMLSTLALAGTGCVEHALRKENRTPDYSELPRPAPRKPEDGSVLRGPSASGSLLFLDRKARGVGDLVTVIVMESMSAQGSANTTTDKTSKIDAKASSDIGWTQAMQGAARWFFGLLGVAAPGNIAAGNELNVLETETTTEFEGDGETTREGSISAVVTCRIIDELEGNVYHIRGKRSLIVNHEKQILTVEGLVRREDISINNTVSSTALAEAQLGFDGFGVLDDKQRPSVMGRVMDWVYPF